MSFYRVLHIVFRRRFYAGFFQGVFTLTFYDFQELIILTFYEEFVINPRGDHWAEFGPRDQCRLCARPKFGPIWYDVVEQFSFPSLVTDPGKKGVIGKLIHSSSCANFIQVQNAVSPNENPRYKTRGKVVPIFG